MRSSIIAKIKDISPQGATAFIPISDWERFAHQETEEIEVLLRDGRVLTAKQSRAINAIIGNIEAHTVGKPMPETVRELGLTWLYDRVHREPLRREIKLHWADLVNIYPFSLSPKSDDCISESEANGFISWLIEVCVKLNIRIDTRMLEDTDVERYVYACLLDKRCCISGKPCELHHVDRVGMGRDRHDICHIGMLALPLAADYHRLGSDSGKFKSIHDMGDEGFMKQFHVIPVRIDERIAKVYRLTSKTA